MGQPLKGVTQLTIDKAITVACTRASFNASGRKRYIESLVFVPDVAVAAHATDGASLAVKTGASVGTLTAITNTYSTLSGGDGALAAQVKFAFSITDASRWWLDSTYLALVMLQLGSGKAIEGSLIVTWSEVP